MKIKDLTLVRSRAEMDRWPAGKFLINTVNAHSFVVAQKDPVFADALLQSDALLPDGISIVNACRWLKTENAPDEKIAGADLFAYEMEKLNEEGGTCFFLGSSPATLARIEEKAKYTYPNIRVITYSPPYKAVFTAEESQLMVNAVNAADPDLLWVGMTAPKQEKWLHDHWDELEIKGHAGAIGAVFDFFAGTVKRAPQKWIDLGLEWLYRFLKEPRRMWRRVFISDFTFFRMVVREKLGK